MRENKKVEANYFVNAANKVLYPEYILKNLILEGGILQNIILLFFEMFAKMRQKMEKRLT